MSAGKGSTRIRHPHLPWIVGGAALVVYMVTLGHGVGWKNLSLVAQLNGWSGGIQVERPLGWLVTLPFKLLPDGWVPLALNVQSALAAAAVLALLTRSVQLLPLDRLRVQTAFGHSPGGLFIRSDAWLPAVTAAVVCGLELGFWQEAVTATGEMVGLLPLAVAVWCLLEYRTGKKLRWLDGAALVWGLGMAENWMLLLTLPLMVTALLWFRGQTIYEPRKWLRFCLRMTLILALGFSLFFLLPLVNGLVPGAPWTLKHALGQSGRALNGPYQIVHWIFLGGHLEFGVMVAAYYLLPLLPLITRLRNEGSYHTSRQARIQLAAIQIFYTFCLGAGLWLVFHPIAGPQNINAKILNLDLPLLSFVYLGALGTGYLAGHFLLLCGVPVRTLRKSNPQFRLPPFLPDWLRRALVPGLYALPAVMLVALAERNLGEVWAGNRSPLVQFGRRAADSLPAGGGVVLADDAQRLEVLRAALAERADGRQWAAVDTARLPDPVYRAELERKWPLGWTDPGAGRLLTAGEMARLLIRLAGTKAVYYLHPSFGGFFEYLEAEPHGLVYRITPVHGLPAGPAALSAELIQENERFWEAAWSRDLPMIQKDLAAGKPEPVRGSTRNRLFTLAEPVRGQSRELAQWYSIALDGWGVRLQEANRLAEAEHRLRQALALNTNNYSAQVSLNCNSNLQHGTAMKLTGVRSVEQELQAHPTGLQSTLKFCGPMDDPVMDFALGQDFQGLGLLRQAIQFTRRTVELVPQSAAPRIYLAGLYARVRMTDQAFQLIGEIRRQAATETLEDYSETALALTEARVWLAATNRARADGILQGLARQSRQNPQQLMGVAQEYAAAGELTNALALVATGLAQTPEDVPLLMCQARFQQGLGQYAGARQTLDHVLTLTNSVDWELDRAANQMLSGDLDGAAAEYRRLEEAPGDSWRPYYGLAQIAVRRHDTVEALNELKTSLAKMPAQSMERNLIMQQIRQLSTPAK